MNTINRREFVAAAAACLCSLCAAETLFADDPTTTPSAATATTVDVGPKTDYTKDGITEKWAKNSRFILVSHEGKLYAVTSVCTHRGGIVAKNADSTGFECPRHHATFDLEGKVTKGPATVVLNHYGISLDDSGHVIVDKSKKITSTKWDDAGSFISLT